MISGDVHNAVAGRLKARFHDLGDLALKNIERPVRAFRADWDATDWQVDIQAATPESPPPAAVSPDTALALPDKPSIAVLAFANLSGDAEQEYFCDGVSEDIITELSRFRSLFVIARNSSFSYKGKSPDIRQVGKELGVRYVLEGSIRRAGQRIRVTGQLIDTLSGSHIWAERYDRVLEDIFAVQEELTQSIVRAIAPQIEAAEQEKLRRRRPESLGAYEIAVRAWAKVWEAFIKADRGLRHAAIGDAKAALTIDARSTLALNALAFAQWQHIVLGTAADPEAAWREGMAAATRAIEVDRSDSIGYAIKGRLLATASDRDRMDEALANARQGYELNPHNMLSLFALAQVEIWAGNSESATRHLHQALRISPRDPLRYLMHSLLAAASMCSGHYANSVEYALLGIGEAPGFPVLHVSLAISYIGLGEIGKAKAALAEARRVGPEFIASRLAGGFPFRKPEHLRRATTFLRIAAGLEDPSAADGLR